jgi:hypothetical protein
MTGDQLDAEDQIKLDTWFQVMLLLEHYRAVTFEPMYARGRRKLASAEDREILSDKLEIIHERECAGLFFLPFSVKLLHWHFIPGEQKWRWVK